MGTYINDISEENLTKNLDFYSEKKQKKGTILFSSEKSEQKQNKENFKKTENSNNQNCSLIEELNKSTQTNSIIETKKDKVKFKFEWKQDNNYSNKSMEVLLVGTFLKSLDNFVTMKKNKDTQIYEYEIYLQKKIYYFKFIVNNKWLCSDLYQTKLDKNNNLNNYIDLTNYKKKDKEIENILSNSTDYLKNISDYESFIKYPELKTLNKNPSRVFYYKKDFSIDKNNKKFCYGYINSSYKKIFKLENDKIGHLIPEMNNIFSNKNYFRISITERNKNKLVTLVYYKPKKNQC